MKKASFTLTIFMSIFFVFTSCSDEEIPTSSEINPNLEILDFSFLINSNSLINDDKEKIVNSEIINEFLNNYDRVLQEIPVDYYINDINNTDDVKKGMTTLILSDKQLYQSFLMLEKNGITYNDINNNFENWNNSERAICIPNLAACTRSQLICAGCPLFPTNCAACLGVAIHCCSANN